MLLTLIYRVMYCNEGSSWMHGEHFELDSLKGVKYLQLGVKDK